MAKVILLNSFTLNNRKTAKQYGLKTNDYIIGVNYTANMDSYTVKYGLKAIQNKAQTAEILVHPCYYENLSDLSPAQKQHYKEFAVFVDKDLQQEIENCGWDLHK